MNGEKTSASSNVSVQGISACLQSITLHVSCSFTVSQPFFIVLCDFIFIYTPLNTTTMQYENTLKSYDLVVYFQGIYQVSVNLNNI